MPWLRIVATVTALVALAATPGVAQAAVTGSDITSWASANPTTSNDQYLISFDNNPTTLSVSGTAVGTGTVDIVCYFGSPGSVQDAVLESGVAVTSGKFTASNQHLQTIAGHACRLRAVPTGAEGSSDDSDFAGPNVAVSEAALPVGTIAGTGLNFGTPYNDYVNDVTLTGYAAWGSPGITPASNEVGCGGPFAAPVDSDFDVGNFAIDCTGSLLSNDLDAFGGRSEVQIDGRNAYDPGSAQALFAVANGHAASQNLQGFPTDLTDHVTWDPTTGLLSSQTDESWVECNGANQQVQTFATCPSFVASGVKLERDITTSDGGRVVTMTDTWSSTDGKAHSLDLLYDDYNGIFGDATGDRGYEFPGQTGFSQFVGGTDIPGTGQRARLDPGANERHRSRRESERGRRRDHIRHRSVRVSLRQQQRVRRAQRDRGSRRRKLEPQLRLLGWLLGFGRDSTGARRARPVRATLGRDRLALGWNDRIHREHDAFRHRQRRLRDQVARGRRAVGPDRFQRHMERSGPTQFGNEHDLGGGD